ncbi:DUF4309 domain-containing protein [Paenibacillus allorhizosphaerae]|uniref:DUF4309 domain-containing protein n=1 Tax=Paenibacillus allorhizosphaerae TaxID=2849866 RepID=A0ABN7TV35_9BACL|nr:DUF4309 domain-containing protein [Paenibacillus allorhizosphaerae]CAG7650975.1 hypothetical protein PAECIP111802_04853 [Paenibacillus allorhizosphaerae]
MKRKRNSVGYMSALVIVLLLAAGCQNYKPAPAQPVAVQKQEPTATPPSAPEADQEKLAEVTALPQAPANSPADPDSKVALVSSDQPKPEEPQKGEAKPNTSSKPKIEIKSPYTQEKPTLLGLTLKTSLEEITEKLGKPKDTFLMEDDADPITVYDYTDFMAGFNKKNQLQFIDIRSDGIDPGLNGLKLGDPVADVSKALGKPDSNTSLVMTYKSPGAILKLDIDPKSQKVNSIKLFAE